MKNKYFYEAPEAELFVVRLEENFLGTGGNGDNQHTLNFRSTPGGAADPGLTEIGDDF